MKENKGKFYKDYKKDELIDPDPAILGGLVFGGISAIAGLYEVISDINSKNQKRQKFNGEVIGFRNTFDKILFSLVLFKSSINDIDRIIHKASRRDEEMNVLDQSM